MNSVSLVGQLTADPELRTNRAGIEECRMGLAVQRRQHGGRPEPGVI
jgi:single-stranded DNA-binding protein